MGCGSLPTWCGAIDSSSLACCGAGATVPVRQCWRVNLPFSSGQALAARCGCAAAPARCSREPTWVRAALARLAVWSKAPLRLCARGEVGGEVGQRLSFAPAARRRAVLEPPPSVASARLPRRRPRRSRRCAGALRVHFASQGCSPSRARRSSARLDGPLFLARMGGSGWLLPPPWLGRLRTRGGCESR